MIWKKKDDKSKRPLLWTHPLEINLFPNNHFDTPHENAVLYIKIPPPRIFYFKPTTRKWKKQLGPELSWSIFWKPIFAVFKKRYNHLKASFCRLRYLKKAIPKTLYSCEIQGIFSIIKWNTKLPKLYRPNCRGCRPLYTFFPWFYFKEMETVHTDPIASSVRMAFPSIEKL